MQSQYPTLLLLLLSVLFVSNAYSQNDPASLQLDYTEIDSLMMVHYKNGAYEKCIPLMKAGRAKAKAEFGAQDSVFADYTNNLGFFYAETGAYEDALQFYTQAKDIFEKALGKDHPQYATSLNNLALLHLKMGNFNKALPFFVACIHIEEKTLGKEHPSLAVSLNNLAGLYEKMGSFDKAVPLWIRAIKIKEKALGKEHPSFATSLNNLAVFYQRMGYFDKALPLLIQAKDIREKALGKDHPTFATSLNSLGLLHYAMGNFYKTLPLYTQAKNIFEKALGKEHPAFATALNNVAMVHKKTNNLELALPLLIEAKDIREKSLGNQHPKFAISLNNLALHYKEMGNFEQALPLLIQTLNIRAKALGKEHHEYAISLNNLAMFHAEMGHFDKALPLLIQATDIRKKTLGQGHAVFVESLNNLAALYLSMGNVQKAKEHLSQVVQIASELDLPLEVNAAWADRLLHAQYRSNTHLKTMISALNQIYILVKKDTTIVAPRKKQIMITDLAIALLAKFKNNFSNDNDKLKTLALGNGWTQRSLSILNPKEHSSKAFRQMDQSKSVLLLQATKSETVYHLGALPDSLIWKDKKMLETQSQLQAKLLEIRSDQEKDQFRNELINLNQTMDDFMTMIEQKYPKYYKLKYQQVDATIPEIQALLDDKTVLIEYLLSDSTVHLFIVDQTKVTWLQQAIPLTKLKSKIKAFHQVLSNYNLLAENSTKSYQKYTQLAFWFYQNILEPALKESKGIENLIFVTDGELGHLPFETFLTEAAPQEASNYNKLPYLVNDYNISYNYSATLWKENIEKTAPSNNGQMLAMAAHYPAKVDSNTMAIRLPTDQWLREKVQPLPAARQEVEALEKEFNGFFAFDNLASEKVIKAKARDYAIIHLALHGLLDNKHPVLSSLAFTEDGDSIESNFWQAHEISKMQLHANLVVLSACETGFGQFEKGNGIASLARAFMYAGAGSLIVSLWQVNDYATSEIMKNLYKNLADGMNIDEALRHAKLQYMNSAKGIMAHPAFWSPFIQIGNTQPVAIQRKSNGTMPWIIGLLVVLLLGGFFVLNRRKR